MMIPAMSIMGSFQSHKMENLWQLFWAFKESYRCLPDLGFDVTIRSCDICLVLQVIHCFE